MSMCAWRLRWNKVAFFNKLRLWGTTVLDLSLLSGLEEESVAHLFTNCAFSKKSVWSSFSMKIGDFLSTFIRSRVPNWATDLRLGDFFDAIECLQKKSTCWRVSTGSLSRPSFDIFGVRGTEGTRR